MKTTVYTFYEQTILDNIDFDGRDEFTENPNNTANQELFNKLHTLYRIFKSEYAHENNKHLNEIKLFSEWLQGLPSVLSVPYIYSEILENGYKFANIVGDEQLFISMENEDKFLSSYWDNLAIAFFTLKDNL